MSTEPTALPILLFNDECAVCRVIAGWVQRSGEHARGGVQLVVKPIGDDPDALLEVSPALNIWDAYETIHLVMPDGSMRLGGEAVAEVLRRLPRTQWMTGSLAFSVFGLRPFQWALDLGYAILSDVRPLLGCESCGTPGFWARPFSWFHRRWKRIRGGSRHPVHRPHFTRIEARQTPHA